MRDQDRTALYRLYGAAGELLYVGISDDYERRWGQHSRKPWWPLVARQTIDWFGTLAEALDAEKAAIKAEKPKYNVTHGTYPARRSEPKPDSGREPEVFPADERAGWPTPEDAARIEAKRARIRAEYEPLIAAARPADREGLKQGMGIQLTVAGVPPFTAEQRRRLRPILAGGLDFLATETPAERARRKLDQARARLEKARSRFAILNTEQPCSCHEWHDVADIADWTQGSGGGPRHARPVREIVATDDIWERSETDHATLTAGIREAGGITCGHALLATTYLDGHVGLNNGLHRWAVAAELGIKRVPVEMQRETEDAAPPWGLDFLSPPLA